MGRLRQTEDWDREGDKEIGEKESFEFRVPSFKLKISVSQSDSKLETQNSKLAHRHPAAALVRGAGRIENKLGAITIFEGGSAFHCCFTFA